MKTYALSLVVTVTFVYVVVLGTKHGKSFFRFREHRAVRKRRGEDYPGQLSYDARTGSDDFHNRFLRNVRTFQPRPEGIGARTMP